MSTSTAPDRIAASENQGRLPGPSSTHAPPTHPWHRAGISAWERRLLVEVRQGLIDHFRDDVTSARVLQMVHGTAHLLYAAGITGSALAEQVAAACTAALDVDLRATGGSNEGNQGGSAWHPSN